jgi:hypothetical protein
MYNKFGLNIDTKLLMDRVNRTNLIIRHSDLKDIDYDILINKISQDLGIRLNIDTSLIDKERYKNNNSGLLFNKLSGEDINKIYKNFSLDKEIYDNESLFWTGK